MPPARSTSSIWYGDDGDTLQMFGVFFDNSLMRARSYSTRASCAMARVCRTVFVLPPMAISRMKALSIASRVTMSRGLSPSRASATARMPACRQSRRRAGSTARIVPLPGNPRPIASVRQFMELAVNMPEQEPAPGHAAHSSSVRAFSSIFPALNAPTPSNTLIRSTVRPSGSLPAAIGPPLAKIVGILQRNAAMIMPGMILSQFGMQTIASKACACNMVSMQSAIRSREGSENFMPACPMAMPSQMPIVLNSNGTPPALRMACLTMSATLRKWTCPGIMSV